MGFSKRKQTTQINGDRLAALAGGGAVAASKMNTQSGQPVRRISLEPDVSRIRRRAIDETPEERKIRLTAKAVNFSATMIARLVIIAAAGMYMWTEYQYTGRVHRGIALGLFAMIADFGRVTMKALEPGTK